MKKMITLGCLTLMLFALSFAQAVEPPNVSPGFSECALLVNPSGDRTTLRALPDEGADAVGVYYNGTPAQILGGAGAWVLVGVELSADESLLGYAPLACVDMSVPSEGEETGIPLAEVTGDTALSPSGMAIPGGTRVSVLGEIDGSILVEFEGNRGLLEDKVELTGEYEAISEERVNFLMSSRGFWQEEGYSEANVVMPCLYTFVVAHNDLGKITITGESFQRIFEVDGESEFTLEIASNTTVGFTGGWLRTANGLPRLRAGQLSDNEIHSARIKIGLEEAPGRYIIRLADGAQSGYYAIYEEGYDRGVGELLEKVTLEPGKEVTTPALEAGQYLELFDCVIRAEEILPLA